MKVPRGKGGAMLRPGGDKNTVRRVPHGLFQQAYKTFRVACSQYE